MSAVEETVGEGVVVAIRGDGLFQVEVGGLLSICHLTPVLSRAGVRIGEGERVTVRTEGEGVLTGEITRVRPALEPRVGEPRVARGGLVAPRGTVVLRPEAQRIDRSLHPGWLTGAEAELQEGDAVYCTAGRATVHRVLGKTGNGSRLLELRLPGQPRSSFFAAASNVLLEPCEVSPKGVREMISCGPRVIG